MRDVDYLIVGEGYAGIFFAHQLIKARKKFVIFSGSDKGASHVSAGIINPLVLKKFTTFWLADEQINFLHTTLNEIENYTGNQYLINENIHRIFHDEGEKELWLSKTETAELKPFLDPEFKFLDVIDNPFGTGSVIKSARLNVAQFFTDYESYFLKNNHLIREDFDYSQIDGHVYKNFEFKHLVFCEGMGVRNNPFFYDIPVIPNKGHHLTVKLSVKPDYQLTLKKKHFLFPINENLHYYGGTYDPNERENEIDDFKKEELIAGLSQIYPHDFEIEAINYGFRPTVKDRRPILGNHPEHPHLYLFNGLGARGILNACYFAPELFEHIENGKDLMEDVDIKRFKNVKA